MSKGRRHWQVLAIWLAIAGVVYRGLIPAGFMPATGEAAQHGALLVVCPHGEMAIHGHGGAGSGGASLEQCPFGAAAGPAVPSVGLALSFTPGPLQFRPGWNAVLNRGTPPRLQPPPRAPPLLS